MLRARLDWRSRAGIGPRCANDAHGRGGGGEGGLRAGTRETAPHAPGGGAPTAMSPLTSTRACAHPPSRNARRASSAAMPCAMAPKSSRTPSRMAVKRRVAGFHSKLPAPDASRAACRVAASGPRRSRRACRHTRVSAPSDGSNAPPVASRARIDASSACASRPPTVAASPACCGRRMASDSSCQSLNASSHARTRSKAARAAERAVASSCAYRRTRTSTPMWRSVKSNR